MPRKLLCGFVVATTLSLAMTVAAVSPSMAEPALSATPAVSGALELSPEVARTAVLAGGGAEARARALAAYWTPERMRAARPAEERISDRAKEAAVTAPRQAAGKPVSIEPAAPDKAPLTRTPAAGSATISSGLGQTWEANFSVGQATAQTVGKVFFTINGSDYVCSGAVVNSSGRSLVWTAAHCLTERGKWFTNWQFVPNYIPWINHSPFGYWNAFRGYVMHEYFIDNHNLAHDIGAAIVHRNWVGYKIQDYLGAQGIAFSHPLQTVRAFGYPASPPYDGQRLWTAYDNTVDDGSSIIYMRNAMNGGSSGGPWLMDWNGHDGKVNGNNGFISVAHPGRMYSPYYGYTTSLFYNDVESVTAP
ncbi:hypothetical protein [Polymorphospora sp. NPDC050346]|uniref:trypsin-like serine peptidase n=1 Tax=Polymorphospora sp. NPDC050346 TaxID=3155780 RepID=UPI00340DD27B